MASVSLTAIYWRLSRGLKHGTGLAGMNMIHSSLIQRRRSYAVPYLLGTLEIKREEEKESLVRWIADAERCNVRFRYHA